MPVTATRVVVGTSPTRLDSSTASPMVGGSILIKNPASSTGNVAIGGSDVTAATGMEIEPGAVIPMSADVWSRVYAITATGTITVQVLEARA